MDWFVHDRNLRYERANRFLQLVKMKLTCFLFIPIKLSSNMRLDHSTSSIVLKGS